MYVRRGTCIAGVTDDKNIAGVWKNITFFYFWRNCNLRIQFQRKLIDDLIERIVVHVSEHFRS